MKKLIALSLLLFVFSLHSAVRPGSVFKKGYKLFTPELVAIEHAVAIGVNFEAAYSKNIGIGGDLLFILEGEGGMIIAPDIAYHLDVNLQDLDLFFGIGPYLAFGFGGGSEFGVKPFFGMRFYFNPKLAAYFKFLVAITRDPSVGGAFGLTFRL